MEIGFAEALLALGILLAAAAGLSGWLRGTVLSVSVLSVTAGMLLSFTGVLDVDPGATSVLFTVELALVLTLFSDGMYAERELVRKEWHAPARALVIAMPITLVLLALAARALFADLTWSECFLLAAVLSPTDPVVSSSVVTSARVPAVVRHTLNLESGLNDGLALPFVLFFLALAVGATSAVSEAVHVSGEVVAGGVIGAAVAVAGALLSRRLPGGGITRKYVGIYALGLGFAAFGLSEVTYGNGLIAVFVAGIALALVRHDMPATFSRFNESLSALFQVITFTVFGALIVSLGWPENLARVAVFIVFTLLIARPAAVLLSFIGIRLRFDNKLFIAWFGPKGVASMLFALLVLASDAPDRSLVFTVASYVVLASIVAHGLTDTVGADWLERRLGDSQEPADATRIA